MTDRLYHKILVSFLMFPIPMYALPSSVHFSLSSSLWGLLAFKRKEVESTYIAYASVDTCDGRWHIDIYSLFLCVIVLTVFPYDTFKDSKQFNGDLCTAQIVLHSHI